MNKRSHPSDNEYMMTATAAAAGIRKRLLVFVLTAVARWQFERESQVKQNNANVFALCFCVPNIHQTIKYHCAMFNVQFVLKGTAKKKSQLEPCPPPTTIAQYKKKKKKQQSPHGLLQTRPVCKTLFVYAPESFDQTHDDDKDDDDVDFMMTGEFCFALRSSPSFCGRISRRVNVNNN